jgi:UDP-N-acetylglucosamine acyltransferase
MTTAVQPGIHPTALISSEARLGDNVSVGPWAIIGDGCEIGDNCVIAARATLERNVRLSPNVKVGIGSVLGGDPQDLKYRGEETWVEIGEGTTIREYATINRGTSQSFRTTVGKHCFLMSYIHLAHDCHVGDGVIISNSTQLAGHVTVEDRAIISGVSAVHQFVRIGKHCFIGGCSRVAKDVPPYLKAVGNPVKLYGLNSVGLQRSGFPEPVIRELKRAYRLLFRSELNLTQALERARSELEIYPEVEHFLRFIEESQRGVGF